MWNNKEVKKRARTAFKAHYWMLVALCFVMVFIGVGTGVGTSVFHATNSEKTVVQEAVEEDKTIAEAKKKDEDDYELGIVKYLVAFFNGSEQVEKIANDVLDSFATTGGIAYKVFYSIDKFIISNDWVAKLIICVSFLLFLAYYFLFRNVLYVGYMRTLEESRTYSKTSFKRVFYIFKMKDFWNVVKVMLVREIWLAALIVIGCLPFIGGLTLAASNNSVLWFILGTLLSIVLIGYVLYKNYQIKMMPYILAINPGAKWKECLSLSKGMMEGNKLHLFGLEWSFIGWDLLSILTLGLLDIFFVRPYQYQAVTEVFMVLREKGLADEREYAYLLKDAYLTCPEPENIEGDINADHGMFAQEYPEREPKKLNKLQKYIVDLNPKRQYSILNVILLFFSFAIVGWVWEVMLYLLQQGQFVNRGTLYGPWLPIYGFGGVLIIVLLKRFAEKPLKLAISALVLCGLLEYFTSFFMEMATGRRYWDYSNYFLNINGRVCFEGLFAFVILGMAACYIVGPLLDNVFNRINPKKRVAIASVLLVLIGADFIYTRFVPHTGPGVTGQFVQIEQEDMQIEAPSEIKYLENS